MFDRQALNTLGWKEGDGNAAYLDKTLRHHALETELDDRVGPLVILRLFLVASMAAFLAFIPLALLAALVAVGGDAESAAVFSSLAALGSMAVFFFVLLGSKLPEPISEWRILIDGRTDRGEAVYQRIEQTLAVRRIPLRHETRVLSTDVRQKGKRLVLRDGPYTAYVSVFSYGTSLYLGWMMWRSRRGWALIKRFVADLLLNLRGRNDDEVIMLRTEQPRAMREAVHAACREGLVIVIDDAPPPPPFFGADRQHAAQMPPPQMPPPPTVPAPAPPATQE